MIDLQDSIVGAPELMMADLDGEAVLLDAASGRYYGLNDVATRIWSLVVEPRTVAEVVAAIQREYDAPADRLARDVVWFVDDLVARQLVLVVSPVHD